MDGAWVDRLERRFGFLAVPGLPGLLTGMTALAALLAAAKGQAFIARLALDPEALAAGQVWRVATFLIVPPTAGLLWMLLWLAMIFACLSALEAAWGEFKLTVFVAIGAAMSTLAALATGVAGDNGPVHLASFLAFARLAPEREVLVMFVFPVQLRWVAAVAAALTAIQLLTGDMGSRARLLAGLSAYLVYFGAGHLADVRQAWRRRGL
ncbi:MAG: hypothetical protein M0D55_13805 [Elusimicrobiota bacterium]|nr:MAG: hypothetical protein M0D55_13805 [Elusimicrobiota bacterium]